MAIAGETGERRRSLGALFNVVLNAATCWYLTGLLAALGFSLGFYLIKPAHPSIAANRDFLDARLADADFRRAVSEARGRLFDAALGKLAGIATKAADTLDRLMDDEKANVALGAAKAALELGPRLRELTELEERHRSLPRAIHRPTRRRRLGWTQAELARRAGIRAETLNRIEQAKRSPSLATFDKVHRALEAGEAEAAKATAGKGKAGKGKAGKGKAKKAT